MGKATKETIENYLNGNMADDYAAMFIKNCTNLPLEGPAHRTLTGLFAELIGYDRNRNDHEIYAPEGHAKC